MAGPGSKDKTSGRGQGLPEEWIGRLGEALEDLGDRSLLNANPLARLLYIERLAAARFNGQILPRGLALRCVVLDCVGRVCSELENEPGLAAPCRYLRLRADGFTCRETSRQLALSREHVSRTIRKKALGLLAEEFLAVTRRRPP